jgi:hypothetical protein
MIPPADPKKQTPIAPQSGSSVPHLVQAYVCLPEAVTKTLPEAGPHRLSTEQIAYQHALVEPAPSLLRKQTKSSLLQASTTDQIGGSEKQ